MITNVQGEHNILLSRILETDELLDLILDYTQLAELHYLNRGYVYFVGQKGFISPYSPFWSNLDFDNGIYGGRHHWQKVLKYILATLSPETKGPFVMDSNFLKERLRERKAQYLANYGTSLEKQCAMDGALDPSDLEELGDPLSNGILEGN